jgi:hypothetical protein
MIRHLVYSWVWLSLLSDHQIDLCSEQGMQ